MKMLRRVSGCMAAVCVVSGLLTAPHVHAQTACQYYAAPQGTGNGLSPATPFHISAFWSVATPGKTLCLLDGTYTGDHSMLWPPASFAGTAQQPITIRALNDGKVLIAGGGSRPVQLRGGWGVVEGINVSGGDNATFVMAGHDWVARRIVVWKNETPPGNNVLIHLSGQRNTIEDCAAFGKARKAMQVSQHGEQHNTARRCWTRYEECPTCRSGNPTVSLETGYDQSAILAENMLATWHAVGTTTSPEAPFTLFSTRNTRLLGSIGYVPAGANFQPPHLLQVFDSGGSHQGSTVNSNILIKDYVGVIAPGHAKFHAVRGYSISGGAGSQNRAENVIGIAGVDSTCPRNAAWTCVQTRTYSSIAGRNIWQEVPGICKRYVKGTLTQEPLWPWPMNQRIHEALRQSGRAPVDITRTMEDLLGPLPPTCTTGAPTTGAIPSPRNLRILSTE